MSSSNCNFRYRPTDDNGSYRQNSAGIVEKCVLSGQYYTEGSCQFKANTADKNVGFGKREHQMKHQKENGMKK